MKANAQRLIAARLGFALITLFLVSAIVFTITGLLPGDAAEQALGQAATPEQVAALRHQFGLDQSAVQGYFQWLVHAVSGSFGTLLSKNMPVRDDRDAPSKYAHARRVDGRRVGACRAGDRHSVRNVSRFAA